MRSLLLLVCALVAGCSTAPGVPIRGVTSSDHKCTIQASGDFVGQPATSETGAAILRATNAAMLRWAPPGAVLTMDYREDRVTVHLDADGKVTEINCG